MALAPIRRIYEISVNGRPVVFYTRFIGEVGRDIAAVKYALGDVYQSDISNASEDDGTLIGGQWFACDGDQTPLTSVQLATFDKRLQKSLMSFQLNNQFLIMNYYWHSAGLAAAIEQELNLPQALERMIYLFDSDYGTISEATIAVLHGWRPGSDPSNKSFQTSDSNPIEQIPEFMHEMYLDGTLQDTQNTIYRIYDFDESKNNENSVATRFDAAAADFRKWKDRVVTNAEEQDEALAEISRLRDIERYVEYRTYALVGSGVESELYVATKEVLQILEDISPEDISPEQRESLIAAAVEPDHLTQVVPFPITNFKIGFFDRTDFSFQNLPDFDGISEEKKSSLESSALEKVLEFYNKSLPDVVNPSLIKFVDLRAPSLRPGDVYRAFFHIDKQILDSLSNVQFSESTDAQSQEDNLRKSVTNRLQDLENLTEDIESEFCTGGKTLTEEETRIQYEKYRSFASKKKLEISREITQKVIRSRDPANNVDGIDVDLGIFGRGHLDQKEMNSLIGNLALGAIGGIADLFESEDAAETGDGPLHWEGTYDELLEKISEVSKAFLEFSKDLENYDLKQTSNVPFTADREVRFLREFTDGMQNLVRTVNSGKEEGEKEVNLNSETPVKIQFSSVPKLGSKLEKILINKTEQVYPISGKSISYYPNALTRNRTVHYVRNINKMYEEVEDGLFDVCKDSKAPVGTGTAYIMRYTVDVSEGTAKKSENTFLHAWGSSIADNVVDTIGLNEKGVADGKGYNLIPSPTFGFEKTLPSLGENCFKKPKKVRKLIKNTFDMKRMLCEYIACLRLPGVQAQIPNIPKLRWPKLPTINFDAWKNIRKNAEEIGARIACMFLKGILDILNSPMCEERFAEGIFGAASEQAPEVQRALASGFLDTGIPVEKQQNAKDLIDALMEMLSPRELCALLNGEQVNDEVYQIVRTIAQALGIGAELQTREQISNFFIPIGLFVGPALCDELSRFESKIETCEDIYSLAAQIRTAALKGDSVSPEQVQAAIDHAENQLKSKADAMNFLFNGGSLQDLLPDFTSLENNPAFSKPNALTEKAALQAAKTSLGLAEMAFVGSINGYVESFFLKEPRMAQPGDTEYNYDANLKVQRAVCNLQNFATNGLEISDFSSPSTTLRLRQALLLLCDDYKTQPASENPDQQVYVRNAAPAQGQQPGPLLAGSLVEEYGIKNLTSEDLARVYNTTTELQTIWSNLFPFSAGDLDGSTRTASSLVDWIKPVFNGGGLTPADISTLNTNYLNKINQIIEKLQEQITNNLERAFVTRNENMFLPGIKEFYEPQTEQDGEKDILSVTMENKLVTTLKHPVESLRSSMQVEILEDFGPTRTTDVARTEIKIIDDFFLKRPDDYVVQYCEKIPERLQPPNTDVLPRPAAYQKVLINSLKEKYQQYRKNSISLNQYFSSDVGSDIAGQSFLDAYEGLYEQIANGIRGSRIFTDEDYRERLDLKLRSKFYFDPKTNCFKNPKSNPKFGVLNFEKLITQEFPDQYMKEFSSPLNSPLTEDYSTPGAFEKAMMNVSLLGFIRMCMIEVLMKSVLTLSVWDIDFVRTSKIYRDYLVEFVKSQVELQSFFTNNRSFYDETVQRLSATSNIKAGFRKIVLKELDGIISSLAKDLYENEPGYDFSRWFLDSIPFVQLASQRAEDGRTWLTNVDFSYADNLKYNNFVYLEDYMRINGSIRSFTSSRAQIANAQLQMLESKMDEIREIKNKSVIPGSGVDPTDISNYDIGSASSVSLEGVYNDNDEYANTELMSVKEFSGLIKSLVDNNSELSRYFHKISGKTYDPDSKIHGLPDTLSRAGMPSRVIKRTRQHVKFDKANIFTLQLKKDIRNPNGPGEMAIDKFMNHFYNSCKQVKDGYLFNVLTTGEYGEEIYQNYSETAAKDLIRRAYASGKPEQDRYYVITDKVQDSFEKQVEYSNMSTSEVEESDVYEKYNFKVRTGSGYFTNQQRARIHPPENFIGDASEGLNFKASNFKSGNSDPALRESNNQTRITRRQSGPDEYLFYNPKDKTSKEQYDLILEENPDLPSEIWEETVIDLVGDAAPTFMFPGDSGWVPKDHLSRSQKELIGKKLKNIHKWFDKNADGYDWIPGIIDKLYELDEESSKVVNHKTAAWTDVFAWNVADNRENKTMAFPIKSFGSAYGEGNTARSSFDNLYGKHDDKENSRTYYRNDLVLKRSMNYDDYRIDYETEQLTPNEYKIPLRILITQVKNSEGQILKVFVKYVLPQFLSFEQENLNTYRAEKMTEACVDTLQGYQNLIIKSFREVMISHRANGGATWDDWKGLFTRPEDPLNSPIYYDTTVLRVLHQSQGFSAVPVPPFIKGTNDGNSWAGSRWSSWTSPSKLYSHACRIEADNKEGNFSDDSSFIDGLFKEPGNLLRKPGNSRIDTNPKEAFTTFKNRLLGDFSGSGNPGHDKHVSPDALNDSHARNLEQHIRQMFMNYNLSKHILYDHSMHETLRTYTGLTIPGSTTIVPNSGTCILQTVGNLVSWFSQKRVDSFWGKTSLPENRWKLVAFGDDEKRDSWTSNIDPERFWEISEAENNRCGPSLFYNDLRTPTSTLIYNALQHFDQREKKHFAKFFYKEMYNKLNLAGNTEDSWNWLLKNGNQLNAYTHFYYSEDGHHFDENITQLIQGLFLDSEERIKDPGHDGANFYLQSNNRDANPAETGHYFYWNLTAADAKRMNMYMHPTEVPTLPHNFIPDWKATNTIRTALNEELIDYKRHIVAIVNQSPSTASSILARWDAALEELGVTKIIREVTTGYTSLLEGDETIISDILEESQINYGLRMSMHSTATPGGSSSYRSRLNEAMEDLWTINSNTSEEERCGKLRILNQEQQEKDFFSIPVASHEFPLASIECFQATNLILLEQKIKEIQPQMKASLKQSESFKDFFEFILPYKTMATSLTIHGTTILSGFNEMPLLLSSTKSALASAFAASTLVDPLGENTFGQYPSAADVLASLGPTGFSGGEDPECFEAPDIGEWLKMLFEMIKQFVKYFPSIVFRNISDQIDPMYKEMKRHYLACELPDLRNGSWESHGGRYSKTPLGLYGSERLNKKYLPVNVNFPVDFTMGIVDYAKSGWTNPDRLLLSLDRFVGYIFGGPLPLFDGQAAFRIPCAKINNEGMSNWTKYQIGTNGRYGHPISPLNLIALQTLELPRDLDLRRSICQSSEIPDPKICDEEE